MRPLPNAGLALLTLRRTLGGGTGALLAVVALVAARARWTPRLEPLAELLEGPRRGAVAHALTLQGVWSALLLAAAPLLVFRAAAVVPRWRRGEVDWLASAPVSRWVAVLSAACGLALALAVTLAATGAVAGLAATAAGGPDAAPELRVGRALSLGSSASPLDGPLRLEVDPGPRAAFVRVALLPVGGGHAARVRMTLARGGERRSAEVLVAARAELRAPVPPGSGPVALELERLGEGPLVALAARSAVALEPAGSRAAGLSLAGRALAALACWCALALGLGAWMDARLAAALTLSIVLLGLTSGGALPLAGADLPAALALTGEGLVPSATGAPELARVALGVALGLALARAGLADWSRT